MNDLISRKDVIDLINRFVFVGYQEPNEEIREEFINHIKEIPTAFDLEGVIEKLEKNKELAYNRHMDCSSNIPTSAYVRYSTQYRERKSCLEIVKSGITAMNGKNGG